MKKNKNEKKKIIIISLVILIILGFSFAIYVYVQEHKKNETKTPEEHKQEVTEQYEEVSKESAPDQVILDYQKYFNNEEIVGELEIPNTSLKVPVAHTVDNDFYLNHLIDRSPNALGSVFLDYRNKVDDRKIIIYGHNSQNVYTEFNVLENYLDWNYYLEHSDIYFRTLNERAHYLIFSVYVAIADYRYINLQFTNDQYNYHLQYLKEQSVYDTGVIVNDGDEIIVLQTCYFNPEGSYLIIVGKKV